jgi:hypothetical protein
LIAGIAATTEFAVRLFFRELLEFYGNAQCWITDDQRGIGIGKHGGGIRRCGHEFGRNSPEIAAQKLYQRRGTARTSVQRNAFREFNRLARDHQNAADFAFGGHRHFGKDDDIFHPLIFDRGNNSDICVSTAKRIGAFAGHGERKIVAACQWAVRESPYEGRGVQIFDDRNA